MVLISEYRLTNSDAQAAFASHELGIPIRKQIESAHTDLSSVLHRREEVQSRLDGLTRVMEGLDGTHDDYARAVNFSLQCLIIITVAPKERAWFQRLHDRLYPDGLAFINASYADEAGRCVAAQRSLTKDDWARMAAVQIGRHTLAELCRKWLDSGIALGRHLIERERLQESVTGQGSETPQLNLRSVRRRWVQAVNMLIAACDLMNLSDAHRKALLAPLERLRTQSRNPSGDSGDDVPDDDLGDGMDDDPGDIDMDAPVADPVAGAGAAPGAHLSR